MADYNLTAEEQIDFECLLAEGKQLYPDFPEEVLKVPIVYYIKSGKDDDCFHKLEMKNKSNGYVERHNYEEVYSTDE